MLSLFVGLQYLGIVVMVIEILVILKQRSSQLQMFLLIEAISTLVNNVGYLFELQSTTPEAALLAVQFPYIGKPFIVLSFFFFILEFYEVKYPAWLMPILATFHISVTLLVFSCKHNTLYYRSMEFVDSGFGPHFEFERGIIYYLYAALNLVYLIIMFAVGVRKVRETQNIREVIWSICLSSIPLICALGLIVYLSGLTHGYDTTMPAMILANTIAMVLIAKYDLLDTITMAKEAIVDELSDGILVLDVAERILYANHSAHELYPSLKDSVQEQLVNELHSLSQSGERLRHNDEVFRISEKDVARGNIIYGRMFVATNITESYLHEKEMEEQKEIAESANHAKSAFLAKMSHEIRTPINAIIGMDEMILRESKNPEVRGYAMDVSNSAKSLLDIVNDILDSSKIESGKMEILPVKYQLDNVLIDVVNMLYVRAQEKPLNIHVEVQRDLPLGLFGDDVRIRQILLNLMTNAVKYTLEGSVSFTVTGTVRDDEALLHFEVKDTGIGIKEEDLPKLYQSFGRIEERRNRMVEGTGLGMVIVAELLSLMGSKIEVESVYGEGSTFHFDLRQPVWDYTPIGNFEERRRRTNTDYTYTERFTAPDAAILVVDDNDVNRKVFKNLLKKTKVQIDDVNSGMLCLKAIEKKHYDMIFMDHMMPEMDGVETLRRMRKMDHLCKDTPVVIQTANAIVGAEEQYLEEGFDAFLSKPVLPDKLEKLMSELLPQELLLPAEEPTPDPDVVQIASDPEPDLAPPAEELPELEEFDWNYARSLLRDDEILKTTLIDTYHSLKKDGAEIDELAGRIDDPDALELYRIKVHALKGISAMVGALLLSKLARLLEVAAKNHDMERIERLHPVLMEEIAAHRERLKVFVPEQKKKPITDLFTIKSNLYMLQDCLAKRDFGAADFLLQQLMQYAYEDGLQEKMDQLALQVMDLEAEAARETANQVYEEL